MPAPQTCAADRRLVLMSAGHGLRVGVRCATTAGVALLLVAGALRRRVNRAFPDRLSTPPDAVPDEEAQPNQVWTWSVDRAGNFISSSPASLDMIGYGPAELVGQNVSLVLDAVELKRASAVTEALGGPGTGWPGVFVEAHHRNGTRVWLQATVRPRYDPDGTVAGGTGTTRLVGPDAENVAEQQRITARIETVLTDRSLMTAFQPIVGLATNSVIGVEALSRFGAEPARTPDLWFAEAASVGLGTRLELLAIETALTTAESLPEHLYVSVNASPTTCLDTRLTALIAHCAVGPGRLILELTEHDVVADYDRLGVALKNLRCLGVKVAVDDAGSGFASFQHILRLRPDFIKLDRCIVADLDTSPAGRALCAAVVSFAGRIGAQVVAEGIETQSELSAVTELGMRAGQGFYLGRPSLMRAEWAHWQENAKATQQVQLAISGSHRGHALDVGRPATAEHAVEPDTVAIGEDYVTIRALNDAGFAETVFEALPDATAILDRDGTITAVNEAWRMFALDNGGPAESTGVGVSYLDVCTRAAESGSSDAAAVLAGLQAVLGGATMESDREYPCDSPSVSRWFISRITAIDGPSGGAVASHVNITRRKRAELENQQLALHDPLTGVANRLLFTRRLTAALSGRTGCDLRPDVGVLYIDLDALAAVNDRYGHAAGDEFLMVAAHRILVQLDQRDTLARLGGGMFAICATRTTAKHLAGLADRIAAVLAEPQLIHGRGVLTGASVGRYLAAPNDTASQSLQAAEQAMYAIRHRHPSPISA